MSQIMHDTIERLAQRANAFVESNQELWEEGMKLSLLESKEFLESYEQARYWVMYKPIKGNESQVQAVKVEVSNNSCSEFSQTLKRMLPCEFEHHHAVKIQTYDQYQQLLKARLALEADIKAYEKEINDEAMHALLQQSLKKIEVQYFGLLYEWKFPASTYRIVILARGEAFKDLNYFIYNEETKGGSLTMSEMKAALYTKTTDRQKLRNMAEIIKIHHLKRKNQATLQKIQQRFKQSIGTSFTKSFKQHKQEIQNKKRQLNQNQMLIKSFQQYQYKESRSFIQKWKNAVKNAKVNLFVEVFAIYINKTNIPVSVRLIADGSDSRSYEYKCFENDYLVYEVSGQNQQKFFRINIDDARFCKEINFQIEIKLKNSQIIRYNGDHVVYVLNKRQSLFTQELILQSQILNQGEIRDYNTYCIIYLNQIFSRTQRIKSLVQYFQSKVFQKVGSVPSKYTESYKLDYNPSTFKTIRTLLNNQTYPTKLSKFTFQKTYFQLLRFSQREENKSQRSIILTPTTKRNNKFIMNQRYQIYTRKLLQGIGYYSKGEDIQSYFKKNHEEITNNILTQKSIAIPKNQHKNFLEDLKLYNPKNASFLKNEVMKFIYFASKASKLQSFPYQLRYNSHIIPIFEGLFELYLQSKQNDLGSTSIKKLESYTNYLFTFIAFFAKLYPYAEYSNLKSDLYILRWLVQKKLSNFNDTLNRDNIGLQNFITPHLLHFFTGLPSELTYRIWDLLISTEQQRDQTRILVAFTLLTFYEATDRLPIIPINQFMERVEANIRTISVDKQFAAKFAKVADTYYSSQKSKEQRLLKHIKSEEVSIVEDRILKKIILGQSKLKVPYEEEGKIPISRTKEFEKQNSLTIKELRYPLPQANYLGSTIIQIIIFVHDLHILENINLNTNKYWLKFYIQHTEWKDYTQILQKDYFYNKSIRIPSEFINFFHIAEKDKKASIQRHIKVDIVTNVDLVNHDESREKIELKGFIDYGLYHKDTAYKALVNLNPQNLHNKGRTILALTICLKSHLYDRSLTAKQTYESLETLSQKLLDYDIGQGNQCITAWSRLSATLQKIKFPLDQFSSDQYKRITNRALYQYEPNWLLSSLTSIEQLKAIFYNLFSHQKDKSIKHEFYKFYEIFAEEHNMQFVYFAEMLVKFIMLSNISRKKKLMYLYCVAVHYQNCYSKKVNLETINSIVRLIFKQHSLINACPFIPQANGKIIQAYFFQSDLKSEFKKDFTDIVQDWAYICHFKFGYNDIILGSARDLSILKSFFDLKTLQKMESQRQCRFQIVYEVQGFRYIWSATVDPKTFEIAKRGTKFLNQFTGYSNIKYLDSTQEYLLNCENVIPLHNHRSYNYEDFTRIMLSNHLIRYLLDLPSSNELSKRREEEQIVSIEWEEQKEGIADTGNKYNSWAICRGQNCLESWHQCAVIKTGKIMSKVKFQFDKDHQYSVATLDLIAMDEIDINSQKK